MNNIKEFQNNNTIGKVNLGILNQFYKNKTMNNKLITKVNIFYNLESDELTAEFYNSDNNLIQTYKGIFVDCFNFYDVIECILKSNNPDQYLNILSDLNIGTKSNRDFKEYYINNGL